MKKILLTQRLIENKSYPETRECLDVHYAELIYSAGFLPIILPYQIYFKDYFTDFKIDGILITGGNDLDICSQNILSKQRDAYEKALIEYAIKKKIPIFGICRGMQIIADYFSSTFKQVCGQIGTYHSLNVNKDSKYYNELSKLKKVNSYYNFSVNDLGSGLIASATTSEGMIKAMEHRQYPIFAQMWHSEREQPFIENEIALLKIFFNKEVN